MKPFANEEPVEPMDHEMRSLLRRGAAPLVADADGAARARMLAAITAAAAAPALVAAASQVAKGAAATTGAGGVATTVTTGFSLAKVIAIAAFAFAVGGGTGAAVVTQAHRNADRAPPTATVALPPVAPVASPVVTAKAVEPTPTVELATLPDSKPAPSVVPSVEAPRPAASSLVTERKIVDEARLAFARGDSAAAIAVLEQHERTHAHGQLSEERDALRIRALAELGRTDEARERAAKFRTRYPQSLLGPAVEAAVAPR